MRRRRKAVGRNQQAASPAPSDDELDKLLATLAADDPLDALLASLAHEE